MYISRTVITIYFILMVSRLLANNQIPPTNKDDNVFCKSEAQ